MNMTSRTEVYAAIDSERAYQIDRFNDKPHELDSFLVYMQHYLTIAIGHVTNGNPSGLDDVRKIIALGVACMEQHGAPYRAGYNRLGRETRSVG